MNCDSWEVLKNFFSAVIIGWMLIRVCGVIVLMFWVVICSWIICFIWVRLVWSWFWISLLIVRRWWLLKWSMSFFLMMILFFGVGSSVLFLCSAIRYLIVVTMSSTVSIVMLCALSWLSFLLIL